MIHIAVVGESAACAVLGCISVGESFQYDRDENKDVVLTRMLVVSVIFRLNKAYEYDHTAFALSSLGHCNNTIYET